MIKGILVGESSQNKNTTLKIFDKLKKRCCKYARVSITDHLPQTQHSFSNDKFLIHSMFQNSIFLANREAIFWGGGIHDFFLTIFFFKKNNKYFAEFLQI